MASFEAERFCCLCNLAIVTCEFGEDDGAFESNDSLGERTFGDCDRGTILR